MLLIYVMAEKETEYGKLGVADFQDEDLWEIL